MPAMRAPHVQAGHPAVLPSASGLAACLTSALSRGPATGYIEAQPSAQVQGIAIMSSRTLSWRSSQRQPLGRWLTVDLIDPVEVPIVV